MPGNFTPRSVIPSSATAVAEAPAPVQETAAPQTLPQQEVGHGTFSLGAKPQIETGNLNTSEAALPEKQEVKKISLEEFRTPGYKNVATRVVLMPNILDSLKKNLDESKSEAELKFYGNSIAGQIEILESAQRTFKQIGTSTEDEAVAKNLMAAVNEYMQKFSELDKKTKKIIVEGKARKIVGAEVCIPLKAEDGSINPNAEAIIKQNIKEGSAVSDTPAAQEAVVTETAVEKKIENTSSIKYMRPDEDTAEPPVVIEKKEAPAPVPSPETEIIANAPVSPSAQPQAAVRAPAIKEVASKEKDVDPSVVQINRLWPTIRGKEWPKNIALAAMMACVPVPQAPAIKAGPTQKTSMNNVAPSASLSLEDKQSIAAFSPSLFGLSDAEYAAVCAKMEQEKITPYKMLTDSSFVEFYIPTANGTRNVRNEVSALITNIAQLAERAGIQDSKPKEFGNETLEEYVGTRLKALSPLATIA